MALTDSFPGPTGLTDSIEAGRDLAALVLHENGAPKAGLTWKSASNLLSPRSDMRVDIAPFKAVLVRDGAVRFMANVETDQSPEFTVPTANSRIDVLYVKVGEHGLVEAEMDGPFFGVLQGQPSATPVKPTLNIPGALEIGTVLVPSTATNTSSSGVVPTTTAPLTAAAGGIGPWANYTPTLTNFAVGTGGSAANDCQWRREGDLIRVRYRFVIGTSGPSMGVLPMFSLPVPSVPLQATAALNGVMSMYDLSTVLGYVGFATVPLNDPTKARLVYQGAKGLYQPLTGSEPFTWAPGDSITGEFTYRPAA